MAEAGDARGLLKDLAPVGGFDGEDLVNFTLTDDRITLPAHAGVHEQLVDVLQTGGAAVDVVLTLAGAVIPAGDHDLRLVHVDEAGGVVQHQRDFSIAGLLALGGAAEDDVLHLAAAQGAGGLFAHDPADGVGNIRFARTVGADDGGDVTVKGQNRLVGKGFKTLNFQRT